MPTEIDNSLGPIWVTGQLAPLLFEHGASLPGGRRAALMAALNVGPLPGRLVGAMEALYGAMKDDENTAEAVIVVCGQCAHLVCAHGFHDSTDRAAAILQACRRGLGLTADPMTPDPDSDPEPEPIPEPIVAV